MKVLGDGQMQVRFAYQCLYNYCRRAPKERHETETIWAVVVVKWSVCSPSTPTIRVSIPLTL